MNAIALLVKAASLGVHVVQIADNLPLHRLAPAELDALGCRAAELGIAIEVGTRGTASDHLRGYLEIARRVRGSRGSGGARMPAGLDVSGLTVEQLLSLKTAVDGRLAEIVEKMRKAKVGI
jgi:hypothetical protein